MNKYAILLLYTQNSGDDRKIAKADMIMMMTRLFA